VLHVVWTLYDLSNETTKAMQLNDVPARSLGTSVKRSILGYMPQFVTAGHVVNKLPYIGLLSPTQLRENASCTLLAESDAKTQMQPRRLCLPLHPQLDCSLAEHHAVLCDHFKSQAKFETAPKVLKQSAFCVPKL